MAIGMASATACSGNEVVPIAASADAGSGEAGVSSVLVPGAPCGHALGDGACAPSNDGGLSACPAGQVPQSDGGCATPTPTPSNACTFETHTAFPFQGKVIESVTHHGRLYNFEVNGNPWTTNGMDLSEVAYFASGPCSGRGAGQCMFETRAFAMFPGNHLIEFVTASGKSWAWENGQPTDRGSDLAAAPRYSEICSLRGAGPCVFDTRAFVNVGSQLVESITAYGKYFAFDLQGNRLRESGADLAAVARYASGPCQGQTTCKLDTRAYVTAANRTIEVVTAQGRVWRFLTETAGFAEVQPSGVPTESLSSWAVACQ